HARSGAWPMCTSGTIAESGGETWRGVDKAMRNGRRTLPGGFSLAQLLADQRAARNHLALPRLTVKQLLLWADAHRRRTGKWPHARMGAIPEAPDESWKNINAALRDGRRGLAGGSTLHRLLAEHRDARARVQGNGDIPK